MSDDDHDDDNDNNDHDDDDDGDDDDDVRISEETLSGWRAAGHCPAFSLPPPNPLICSDPRHTHSAPGARNRRQPELFCLLDRIRTRSWWMPDTRFLVPKCHIYFKFSSACSYLSARACNLNNLAVYALRDQLVEFNYTATTAGSLVRNHPHNKENNLITVQTSRFT